MKPTTSSLTIYRYVFPILFAIFSSLPVIAQPYAAGIDALTDLRGAHWLIAQHQDGSPATDDDTAAMHAIEIAVQQIISCDIDDDRYYRDRPDVPNIDMAGRGPRLNRAVQLLAEAKTNIAKEDAPALQPVKAKIYRHIDDAMGAIEKAVASR
jgi:hypothetical protein